MFGIGPAKVQLRAADSSVPPRRRLLLLSVLLLTSSRNVLAHETGPHDFAELRTSWAFEPGVVIPLIIAAWLYVQGIRRLRAASPHALGAVEIWCYAIGWLTLVVALVSPLHPWGSVLFSAHMTQHELLMLVAAPLLVLGRPMVVFLWALPRRAAREITSWTKASGWRAVWS